jgi:hypothetical protein
MAMSAPITLAVRVEAAGSDADELAEVTAKLRREILQLDVDSVDAASAGAAPPGAKAVDIAVIGTLLVQIGTTAGALTSVVRAVQGWLRPGSARTVRLQLDGDALEITGASSKDQQRLIDLWLERHAGRP